MVVEKGGTAFARIHKRDYSFQTDPRRSLSIGGRFLLYVDSPIDWLFFR